MHNFIMNVIACGCGVALFFLATAIGVLIIGAATDPKNEELTDENIEKKSKE
jgi:hypothetical protein